MRQLATSSLSAQNIATALLVYTYTADVDRNVFFRLFSSAAGNGNYTAYITIQRLGSGSFYEVVPVTTAPVASGVTAIAFATDSIPVKATDVVKIYLLGLAGDTSVAIVTEVWDDCLPNNSALQDGAGTMLLGTVANTGTFTPTTTQWQCSGIATATANQYVGRLVMWLTGSLANQVATISAYSLVGSYGQFTVSSAMTGAPSSGDTFRLC